MGMQLTGALAVMRADKGTSALHHWSAAAVG